MSFRRVTLRSLLISGLLIASLTGIGPVAVFAAGASRAQAAPPKGVELVTSVEGITEYRLANGLRVLLFPDQSKQTATVNITYLVGSRHENYGETGMAHLLEHMVFKGSTNHRDIPNELSVHGARPNGSTSWDRTNYYETFAATDENLEWALKLEADRMVNSFIAKKDLDTEMTVVRNEYESGENQPALVVFKRIFSAAYDWHNYSNLPIGARSDIEGVPIERLQAFYRKYYQPDNAVLLVAGKFDPVKTLQLVADNFGSIPRPTRTLESIHTIEPTQDGERTVTVNRVGDTQFVGAGYHIPAGSHSDFAAIDILTQILGDTPSGRLHKALVETKKAASVDSLDIPLHDPGLVVWFAEVRKEQSLDAARDTLIQTIESVPSKPPTAEEVDRARTGLLKNVDLTLNSAERVGLELSEWMAQGDWRLYFLYRDRLRKVTPGDVQRVAAAYLKPTNRTIGEFIPTDKTDRAEIPPTPDVAALVKDYKGSAVVAEGEAFDPSPANIESRTIKADVPVGLKLALLPKKTRGNTVVAAMTFRFGDEKSLMNRSGAAQFDGEMLMRGTTKHSRQQIQDEFDKLKARVSVFASANQAIVSIETIRENFPAVLRLVAEILREPAFLASEFEQLKQEALAQIEEQRSQPQSVAGTAFSRHMNPYPKGDIRYTTTPDEDIAEVNGTTLEDLKKFYAEFYGGSNGEMAVVGDFDAREIEKLANDLFGSWKSPRPYSRLVSVYQEIPPINQSLETPDKANAFFLAGIRLNLRDDDPDYPALLLGNYMFGQGTLNSRLSARLRQKEGLTYGTGSSLTASPRDKNGQFVAQAIYAPQNVTKLEAAFNEEVARALKDGFTAEEVATAKSGYLQGQQVSRAQDASLARKLAQYRFLDRTLAWDAELEKKIAALTPEQVNAAMRRFIDPSKITIIKAGDFAKTASTKSN
ncbi:MAG TPA: pitrilysin family protein [Blastocatellia bacterium]|nr:pitrilysin family protein [Blastocatellia bacterium]